MTEHTLQTQNLSVGYDETTIIEDLNLEIPAHKVRVIIGANGCGKSTLMKTLSQLSFHAAGADARTSSPVANGTGGNHGGRFGRTWTISVPEVYAEYDQRGLCRS